MIWKAGPLPPDTRPVLFLDRDGVVNEDRHYLADPAQVALIPGAAAAMARAAAAGYALVGVSNQSGLGRGRFTAEDLAAVMSRLEGLLAEAGTAYDGFYYCPHAPEDGCTCRKPQTGLLDEASASFHWPSSASWVVGDKPADVDLGRAAGLGAILVRTGYGAGSEAEVRRRWGTDPRVLIADDLAAAVDRILEDER